MQMAVHITMMVGIVVCCVTSSSLLGFSVLDEVVKYHNPVIFLGIKGLQLIVVGFKFLLTLDRSHCGGTAR